jgi:hypothetical protein
MAAAIAGTTVRERAPPFSYPPLHRDHIDAPARMPASSTTGSPPSATRQPSIRPSGRYNCCSCSPYRPGSFLVFVASQVHT